MSKKRKIPTYEIKYRKAKGTISVRKQMVDYLPQDTARMNRRVPNRSIVLVMYNQVTYGLTYGERIK